MIEHLRNNHTHVQRHNDFSTLPFLRTPKVAPATVPKAKISSRLKSQPSGLDVHTAHVLDLLFKMSTPRPKSKGKLVGYVFGQLGNKVTKEEALIIVDKLNAAGHIVINEKGSVAYQPSLFHGVQIGLPRPTTN